MRMEEQIEELIKSGKSFIVELPYEGSREAVKKVLSGKYKATTATSLVWETEKGKLLLVGSKLVFCSEGD